MKLIRSTTVFFTWGLAATVLWCSPGYSEESVSFQQWLNDFSNQATEAGISDSTWYRAFNGITEPDAKVLKKAAYQPEFTQQPWEYLDARVNSLSIAGGEKMSAMYPQTLTQLENRFGVSKYILLAIWSMESNYGAVLKKKERLHYVPQALATLGWGDAKRGKFARNQLTAALKIIQAGDIQPQEMLGSWAGAMGHTQFIPTSYLAYGVDMDMNGKRDIWNSIPDALATAANLLVKNSWRSGKTWGYEVVLPAGLGEYEGQTKTLAQWHKLGIVRPEGKQFPRPEDKAILKRFAGGNAPAFLMLKNFFVIKRYNNSNLYALAVGLLADRLAGYSGLVQPWPRTADSLTAEEKITLQQLLQSKGYYSGEIDGHLGEKSRAAIRAFQKDNSMEVDGMPTRKLLESVMR